MDEEIHKGDEVYYKGSTGGQKMRVRRISDVPTAGQIADVEYDDPDYGHCESAFRLCDLVKIMPKPKPEMTLLGHATEVLNVLREHCGETGGNEGAADTLRRLIKERDEALEALEELRHQVRKECDQLVEAVKVSNAEFKELRDLLGPHRKPGEAWALTLRQVLQDRNLYREAMHARTEELEAWRPKGGITVRPGDVVTLRSFGPDMTVIDTYTDGEKNWNVDVVWFDGGVARKFTFPAISLRESEKEADHEQ
jgi:uncharacterized protein YodC (DUF2158 family)